MSFWDQFQLHPDQSISASGGAPPTDGINGGNPVDPSQLQQAPPTPKWGYQYGPDGTPIGDTGSVPAGGYQPGNPPPYLPPTGGISGGSTVPGGYWSGDAPNPNWTGNSGGYAPPGWKGFTDPGSAYAKGNANYYNLQQNYWAPDRDAVLAAARMGGADDAGNSPGGFKFDPGPNTPSNPYYHNTGVLGGGMTPAQAAGGMGMAGPFGGGVKIDPTTGQAVPSGTLNQIGNAAGGLFGRGFGGVGHAAGAMGSAFGGLFGSGSKGTTLQSLGQSVMARVMNPATGQTHLVPQSDVQRAVQAGGKVL